MMIMVPATGMRIVTSSIFATRWIATTIFTPSTIFIIASPARRLSSHPLLLRKASRLWNHRRLSTWRCSSDHDCCTISSIWSSWIECVAASMTYSTSPTAINVIDIESSCTVAQDSNVGAYGRVLGKVIPTPRQLAVLKEMDDLQLFRLLGSGGYRETTCMMPAPTTACYTRIWSGWRAR